MKTNKILTLLAGSLAFAVMACSSNPSGDTPDPTPTPVGAAAKLVTTTADGSRSLAESEATLNDGTSMAPATIEIDPAQTFQTIDGFGFAITYSTCYNLLHMPKADREALLRRTYSTTEGYGVSYARISIGCNDFSSTEYTLCDKKGLENFALQSDETDYVIPVLKEILAINPKLKVIAAPWTCPRWMKVKDLSGKAAYDSWTDGHLNPDMRELYAQYFVKFVETMRQNGIGIYAVSPQNEPLNKANCASLYMPWQEEAPFVKSLAGAFKRAGLDTKIYVFDHNYNYDNVADQNDYPIKVYNAMGNSFEGSELVVGAAYHDYGGSNTELDDIHAQASDKELVFTESSIGTWNDGRNLRKRLVEDMRNITLGTVNRYCKAVLVWNLMLDTNRGPNLDGGCQTCYGAIDINPSGYTAMSYNSHYYVIAHMACAAQTGAVRIGTKRKPADSSLLHSEFANPDGTYAAVILNTAATDRTVNVADGTHYFTVTIPASGVVSCKWKK